MPISLSSFGNFFGMDSSDNDIFGFLSRDESDDNMHYQNGESVKVSSEIFAGPSKDAVIFCVDCSHFNEISKGMSNKLV
jgi:hypothetical protein